MYTPLMNYPVLWPYIAILRCLVYIVGELVISQQIKWKSVVFIPLYWGTIPEARKGNLEPFWALWCLP